MRVFVTGSTGLLGNNLVRALVPLGHDVVALARSREKAERMLAGTGARVVLGDMRDVAGFAGEIAGADVVFHTAAYFREYYSPASKGTHEEALESVNVRGTLALLEAADQHGVGRFIHVSSSGAVGMNADGSPGDENTLPSEEQLENLYFRSKAEGDAKIAAFCPRSGMSVIEILPGWMWGPGDAGPTSAGKLYLDFAAGKIPGAPPGGTSLVDARDVARAMVATLTRGAHGDRFIVGGQYRSLREVLDALARASGKAPLRFDVPAPLALAFAHASEAWAKLTGGVPAVPIRGVRTLLARHTVTSAKAERELGVTFRPLDETMRAVVDWYAETRGDGATATAAAPA